MFLAISCRPRLGEQPMFATGTPVSLNDDNKLTFYNAEICTYPELYVQLYVEASNRIG